MKCFKINSQDIDNDHYWISMISQLKTYVNSHKPLDSKIIVIKIQDITSDDTTMIQKIEYKNNG